MHMRKTIATKPDELECIRRKTGPAMRTMNAKLALWWCAYGASPGKIRLRRPNGGARCARQLLGERCTFDTSKAYLSVFSGCLMSSATECIATVLAIRTLPPNGRYTGRTVRTFPQQLVRAHTARWGVALDQTASQCSHLPSGERGRKRHWLYNHGE